MPVCTVGTWSSLCDSYLPSLSALLAREAAYVIFICHACLHCWHVKQPMWYLSAIPVCKVNQPVDYTVVLYVCHTCLHCWHVKQPTWNLSSPTVRNSALRTSPHFLHLSRKAWTISILVLITTPSPSKIHSANISRLWHQPWNKKRPRFLLS